jgi:ribosomal-protein-alanine N-acetyltransferase
MTPADLDRVMEIAESLKDAPHWPRSAFLTALDSEAAPARIALVAEYSSGAEQAAEKLLSEPPQASGHGFSRVINAAKSAWALQTAEKLDAEGGGGFNPRIRPIESTPALAAEGLFSPGPPEISCFPAASLAPEGSSPPISSETPAFSAACGMGVGESVVGFAVASLLPPQAELETIAVASELQRRGLALRLFAALAGELRAAQVGEVFLEARASNHPALGLYLRLGFLVTGRRIGYYQNPVEDAVLMRLRL